MQATRKSFPHRFIPTVSDNNNNHSYLQQPGELLAEPVIRCDSFEAEKKSDLCVAGHGFSTGKPVYWLYHTYANSLIVNALKFEYL